MGINIVFPCPADFPISTIHWSIDHKIWWWNPSCWMVTSAFFGCWHLHMPRNPKICCLSSSIATWCNFSAYAMWIVHMNRRKSRCIVYLYVYTQLYKLKLFLWLFNVWLSVYLFVYSPIHIIYYMICISINIDLCIYIYIYHYTYTYIYQEIM